MTSITCNQLSMVSQNAVLLNSPCNTTAPSNFHHSCIHYSFRSPGGTPLAGWPKNVKCDANLGYFNSKLADKFKNVHSPVLSSLAAPGAFESPGSPSPDSTSATDNNGWLIVACSLCLCLCALMFLVSMISHHNYYYCTLKANGWKFRTPFFISYS